MAVLGLVAALLPSTALAESHDLDAVTAGGGVASLAAALDGLADVPVLAADLPLTATSPAEMLGLDAGILASTLGTATALGTFADFDALVTAIDDADHEDLALGLDVEFFGVTTSEEAGSRLLSFTVKITRAVAVPVGYRNGDDVLLAAGEVDTTATLTTDLDLSYAPGQSGPGSGMLTLVGAPEVAVDIAADDALSTTGRYGFTDVTVGGTALVDLDLDLDLVDPDGQEGITRTEWETTLPSDLVTTTASGAYDIEVDLNSDLVTGTSDGTITADFDGGDVDVSAVVPDDVWPEPTEGIGVDLAALGTMNADDALVGLGQLAGLLSAAQARGDAPIPFTDATVADLFDPGRELGVFVSRQGDALVVCGRAATNPPSGSRSAGDPISCQAFTDTAPETGTVSWKIDGNIVSGSHDATVGPDPTATVTVASAVADPEVTVTFTPLDGTGPVTAERRFRSAQELETALEDVDFAVDLSYSSDTRTLELGLSRTDDSLSVTVSPVAGDALRESSRLTGLEPTSTDFAVTGTGAAFDVEIGFVLGAEDPDADLPAEGETDERLRGSTRTFLKNTEGDEIALASLAATGVSASWDARIGYLPVTVTSTDIAIAGGATDDALAVDIPATGDVALPDDGRSTTSVTDAVLLRDLVNDLSPIIATNDLDATATLAVADAAGLSATGTVTVTGWDGEPAATLSTDYSSDLYTFDVAPTVTGTATGGTTTAVTDTDGGFLTAFGQRLVAGDTVAATLFNLTKGATCAGFTVTSDTELTCDGDLSGPAAEEGGTDVHTWAAGDRYEVRGNEAALAPIIVEALFDVTNRLALADTDDAWTDNLPLVDAAPDELVTVLADAAGKLAALRAELSADVGGVDASKEPLDVPADLVELETELTSRLGVPVDFGLADIDRDVDGTPASTTHLTVAFTLTDGETASVPLWVDLGQYDLFQADATGVDLTHATTATVDVALPLSLDLASSDAYVTTASATLDATVDTGSDFSVDGRIGPVDVRAQARPDIAGTNTLPAVTGTDDRPTTEEEGARTDPPSGTELQDSTTNFEASGVEAGQTVEKLDDIDGSVVASCEITAVAETTVTCDGLVDEESATDEWDNGDHYRIRTADPSDTVLFDPAADDLDAVVAGQLLEKLDASDGTPVAICTVTDADVEARTITCDGLVDTNDDAELWEDGDPYRIQGADGLLLDVTVTLDGPGGPVDDHIAGLAGTITGGDVCGGTTLDDACGELELRLLDEGTPGNVLGTVSHVDDVDDSADPTTVVPQAVLDAIAGATLDWAGLDDAAAFVPGILTDSLDGRRTGTRLPLVGTDLDGGDIPAEVQAQLDTFDLGAAIADALAELTAGDPIDAAIKTAVSDHLGELAAEADVTVECTGGCTEAYEVDGVSVRVRDSAEGLAASVPFETGLPGLNLTIDDGDVTTTTDWGLDVTLGLDRTGPYLEVASGEDLLDLGVTAEIATATCDAPPVNLPTTEEFSASRCLEGTVGLLPATLYDGTGTASGLDATLAVGLDSRLGFADLLDLPSGTLTIDPATTGDVNLLFVSTDAGLGIKLPAIAGVLTFGYDAANAEPFTDPAYADVGLDISTFLPGFVLPVIDQVTNYVSPLEPVIDTLLEPIPVVSDLSKATGGGPISLLTLLQKVSGNDLSLVERIGALLKLADQLSQLSNTGYIELTNDGGTGGTNGSLTTAFTVPVSEVKSGTCGTEPGERDCKKTSTSVGSAGATYSRSVVSEVGKNQTPVTRTASGTATASGAGVTFPFLNDSSEIYGMILGFDATLVRFDAGTLAATAGLSIGFGPFMAGPVPVEVTIGGSLTLQGRFAMGFDTRGLRAAAAGGSGTDLILDGIFIDDFDAKGNDVPEAQLIATITAGASVSVKIFKVGIEGGVTLKFLLDLEDSRAGADGKLRIDTIREYAGEPLCLFEFSSTLEFFLNLFVQIDFKIFTKKFSYELWRLKPPIELFSVSCALPPPVWATVSDGNLLLNIGDETAGRASDRGRYTSETTEVFQVHQLTAQGAGSGGGTDVEVVFQGIALEYTVPTGGKVIARAGSGNDVIQLLPGIDDNEDEVPFTLPSDLDGGTGNDQLDGGNGPDVLSGGDGRDTLRGGAGDDRLTGGAGNDTLEGGLGDDHLDGGAGDDRLTGAAGADVLLGGEGDDQLEAGPGLRPGIQDDDSLEDGRNVLVGGAGLDRLQGGHLDDALFGDGAPMTTSGTPAEVLALVDALSPTAVAAACTSTAAGDAADELAGDAGDDLMVGGGGHDRLDGDEGIDTMCGGAGDDRLDGGDGNDELAGNDGDDRLFGGDGSDTVDGGAGDDLVDGGAGIDTLIGATGADVLLGGEGGDTIHGDLDDASEANDGAVSTCAARSHVLTGGLLDLDGDGSADNGRFAGYEVMGGKVDVNGDGVIDATDNAVIVDGVIVVDAGLVDALGASTIDGMAVISSGNGDCILGGGGDDTVHAGGGADHVFGEAGADIINGDAGDDFLRGAAGDDTINGGAGADTIYGDSGDDLLNGDAGDDELWGGLDDDTINGGGGEDVAHGGAGLDVIHGDAADDVLYGDADDDVIYGDDGDDDIFGGHGNDYVEGNAGSDDIFGEDGDDVLIGGTSEAGEDDSGDAISGGAGDDLIAGDNASYEPPAEVASLVASVFQVSATGRLVLHDVEVTDEEAVDVDLFGADIIDGDAGDDRAYGQGGDDLLRGGDDDDHLEGGHGDDDVYGGAGDDDLIGGSSAGEDGVSDRQDFPSTLTDGDDVLFGGAGDDLLLGDNATATRGEDYVAGGAAPPVRDVVSATTDPDPEGAFGSDRLYGEGGRDQLFGQLGDDLLIGGAADDVLVGDLGTASPAVRESNITHSSRAPFISVTFAAGSVRWDVELFGFDEAEGSLGDDALIGGDGDDSLHAGPGDDVLDGGEGSDDVFGGDGDDVAWGGPGIDRLWGGRGEDHLDVPDGELAGLPLAVDLSDYGRPERDADNEAVTPEADELPTLDGRDEGAEGYLGADLIYGGLDRDAMLADVGDAGRTPGDRLVDAVGNHNAFLRCANAYGEGVVTRQIGPPLRSFLQAVAAEGGAIDPSDDQRSGFNETAIVFPQDASSNSDPHPSVPSSGVCVAE